MVMITGNETVSLCKITKIKFLSKDSTKNVTWKLLPGSFIFKELTV